MMGPSTNHDDVDDDDDDDDDVTTGRAPSTTATAAAIMILHGETFFETNEEDATTFCETRIETLQKELDVLVKEEQEIVSQQSELKKLLYGRFGKSINLEADD
jgi:chaperonin cofactor prefoldin